MREMGSIPPKTSRIFIGGKDNITRDDPDMVYNDLLSTPQLKEAYEAKIAKFEKHRLLLYCR
jgi:hypothetical protein